MADSNSQITRLNPMDDIFNKHWLAARPELQYALGKNQKYRTEVNKWLQFFSSKGWLNERLIKRLQTANTWTSYYSKINELRAGYFFEQMLNFVLTEHEAQTINNKNVEFKGKVNSAAVLIEVKTPLDLDRKLFRGGSINGSSKVCEVLDKAAEQLPGTAPAIVVLSDDLKVPLVDDLLAQDSIWVSFDSPEYEKVSAVCVLGNIYYEDMYKMRWAINPNAGHPVEEAVFNGFKKIISLYCDKKQLQF